MLFRSDTKLQFSTSSASTTIVRHVSSPFSRAHLARTRLASKWHFGKSPLKHSSQMLCVWKMKYARLLRAVNGWWHLSPLHPYIVSDIWKAIAPIRVKRNYTQTVNATNLLQCLGKQWRFGESSGLLSLSASFCCGCVFVCVDVCQALTNGPTKEKSPSTGLIQTESYLVRELFF